jgi:hypothetical protein
MSLARSILDFRCRCRDTALGPNELAIEGAEVYPLLGTVAGLLVGHTGASLVLDDNCQGPALAWVSRTHFQSRDRVNFTEILTLLVAEVVLRTGRDLTNLARASSRKSEERWSGLLFRHEPFHNLFRLDIIG